MSVSNPVDSGGGLIAFDQDLQGFAEQMETAGGWAQFMAQESVNNTLDDEENKDIEEDRQQSFEDPERVYSKGLRDPPYAVQIMGIHDNCDADELYLYFGGEEKIEDLKPLGSEDHLKSRAIITFKTEDYMEECLKNQPHNLNGHLLRVLRMPATSSTSIPGNRYGNDVRQYSGFQPRDSFSRQSSHYGSNTSLTSSQHGYTSRRYEHHGPPRNQYPTMPAGGFRDVPRGYNNRKSSRGDRQGGYDRRSNYGPGDLQRSGSYNYDPDRPAPISRSRTDDGFMDRRQFEMHSRTSSQFSIDDDKPAARKPSSKDIFGDAKPADTAKKMLEVEERLEERKKEKAEKDKAERERLQQQHHQQHIPQQLPHMPPMGYPYTGHQYNHPPHYYHPSAPQYVTPYVDMAHGNMCPMNTPPPNFSPVDQSSYGGPPGSIKIYQRTDVERSNMSPPSDPEHTRVSNVPQPRTMEHPIETIKEEPSPMPPRRASASQDKSEPVVIPRLEKSGSQTQVQQRTNQRTRTFNNSSHKGGFHEGNRGGNQGRGGRGGSRGRGGQHSGGPPHKVESATVQGEDVAEKNNNKDIAADSGLSKDNKTKELHGSQASLSSRRGGFGNRGRGGGQGNRGGYRDRSSKEERAPREDSQRHASKDKQKPPAHQRKASRDEGHKDQHTPTVALKQEAKKEAAKAEVSVPVTKVEATPATPPVDAKDKKKKKKQNAAKNSGLGGNRYAALLDADE